MRTIRLSSFGSSSATRCRCPTSASSASVASRGHEGSACRRRAARRRRRRRPPAARRDRRPARGEGPRRAAGAAWCAASRPGRGDGAPRAAAPGARAGVAPRCSKARQRRLGRRRQRRACGGAAAAADQGPAVADAAQDAGGVDRRVGIDAAARALVARLVGEAQHVAEAGDDPIAERAGALDRRAPAGRTSGSDASRSRSRSPKRLTIWRPA